MCHHLSLHLDYLHDMYSDLFCVDRIKYKTSHVQRGFRNGFPTSEEHEPKPFDAMVSNFFNFKHSKGKESTKESMAESDMRFSPDIDGSLLLPFR